MNPGDLSRLSIERKERASTPYLRPALAFAVVVVAGVIIYYVLNTSGGASSSAGRTHFTPAPLAASSVTPGHLQEVLSATGYVVAQRSAAVSSKATGRLKELSIREGDLVSKGQVLGVLENDDLQASVREGDAAVLASQSQVKAAEAESEDARRQLGRLQELRKSSFSSQSDIDAARTRLRKADSQVETAKAQVALSEAQLSRVKTELEYTFIRAPFDGTVLKKSSEVGEIVAPFGSSTNARAAIALIADMNSLQVEADVSEANLSRVHLGQRCEILLDSIPDQRYAGVVDKIVPTVDRAKATVLTKIRFLEIDGRVIPEMSARVTFLGQDEG